MPARSDAFTIRPATREDAAALRQMLDAIVRRGGTTAIERTPGVVELADWFIDGEGCLACFVAESAGGSDLLPTADGDPADGSTTSGAPPAGGVSLGFQAIGTHDTLPSGCADIATYVRIGLHGHGIGTALFEHTLNRARELGLDALNATIRADNADGLAYYSGLGFAEHATARDMPLTDGTPVDRVSKRFPLGTA